MILIETKKGRKMKYQQIKVTEVLCRSIGIGLYTGVITYLLFRNSALPCVGGCVYSTLVDDQETMVLDVYEGERPHVKFCRYLGEVTILGIQNLFFFYLFLYKIWKLFGKSISIQFIVKIKN